MASDSKSNQSQSVDTANKQFLEAVHAYLAAKEEHKRADELNQSINDDTTFIYRNLIKPAVGKYCNQRCEKYKQNLEEKKQTLIQLLKEKPDLISAITSKQCCTAFHYAVERQDPELLALLTNVLNTLDTDISIPDSTKFHQGVNPLMLAIKLNNDTMVDAILQNEKLRNAWLNNQTPKKQTPLYLAVAKQIPLKNGAQALRKNERIVNSLLKHQAEFGDHPSKNSPLHLAAINGKTELISTLIKKEYSVNDQNDNGDTPLHLALKDRNVKTAKILVKNGADVTLKNKENKTPIEVGQDAMKNTRWWQAMVEGGFGESACPMEATSGIISLIMNQFARLNLLQGVLLSIASIATLGIALIGFGAVFLINGYTQRRLNYGESAQGALATMLEATTAETQAQTIAKELKALNQLKKRLSQAKLLDQPISKEDLRLCERFLEDKLRIKASFDNLPDRHAMPESWKSLDPIGKPSLEKQRLYATPKDKRAALIGGIGKGLGTGSALASVLFSGLALVGFFTAPTVIGAVLMGIGIAGVIAVSGTVAANGYRMSLEEYGLKNQQYHRQMHRIDEIYDTLFEGIDKDNIDDKFLDLQDVLKPSSEKATSLEELLSKQAEQFDIDFSKLKFPLKEDAHRLSWLDKLSVAIQLESVIKDKVPTDKFNEIIDQTREQTVTAITNHDLNSLRNTILLSPCSLGSVQTFIELIQHAIDLNQSDTVELLLNAYGQLAPSLDTELLHQLVRQNNQKMVEAIVKTPLGRSWVNHPDKQGKTPLHYAAEHTIPIHEALPKRKANYAITKALLDAGADPTLTTPDKNTALHLAAKGFVPLDKNTKRKQKIKGVIYNRSYNAQRDKSALLKLLCQRSKDISSVINLKNDAGDTPIHRAVKNKNLESAMVLTEFGADYDMNDTKRNESAITMGKRKIANKRWKTAMIDSIGDSSCPVESTVTVTSLMMDRLKHLSVMSVLGLTILSVVTFGVALVGAATIFFVSAYKEKQVNYGEEAQQKFELQLLKAKITGIANKRAKLEKESNAITEKIVAYQSASEVPEKLRQQYDELQQQSTEYNNQIDKYKKHTETIPEQWKFDPNAEENRDVLQLYATRRNKVVSALSAIGKSAGVASAVAGTSIALITAILGLVGGAATVSIFGAGIPLLAIGVAASIVLAVGIGVAVGYYAYQSTKQEFGEMHQANHCIMLANNQIIDKKITPISAMKPIELLFDTEEEPDLTTVPSKKQIIPPSKEENPKPVVQSDTPDSEDVNQLPQFNHK